MRLKNCETGKYIPLKGTGAKAEWIVAFRDGRAAVRIEAPAQIDPMITKDPMTALERRAVASLAILYSFRMLGLFMVLPLLALYAGDMRDATPQTLGLALGVYGLTQALLQIPLGMLSDRIGRKPVILGGLLLFALGSAVAAQAQSLEGIIVGRALQGAGAIAGTLMALVADLTSDEQRTKAMALVGMSIGLSFTIALILGPVLATFSGLAGVFWLTAGLALFGCLLLFWVPDPPPGVREHRESGVEPGLFWRSLRNPALARLNLGIFTLHAVLMAVFLVMPGLLEQQLGIAREEHWWIYTLTLLLSLVGMVPLMIRAERKSKLRETFLLAVGLLATSMLLVYTVGDTLTGMLAALWLMFVAFNYLEATLPSLVSKTVNAGGKGTALGIYSTCQFGGAFVGGAAGGSILQAGGAGAVLLGCACLAVAWLLLAWPMATPRNLTNLTLRGDVANDFARQVERLRGAAGVVEVQLSEGRDVAWLRVDYALFDDSLLPR